MIYKLYHLFIVFIRIFIFLMSYYVIIYENIFGEWPACFSKIGVYAIISAQCEIRNRKFTKFRFQ